MDNASQPQAPRILIPGAEAGNLSERVQQSSRFLRKAAEEIGTIFYGQDEIIRFTIACMAARGHLLAEGAPGAGKTYLVSNIAKVMGMDFKRVSCNPDLIPSDILGSAVQDKINGGLRFIKGPIFTQFLMADEINRTGPKVQSAFLEAMQERQVTIDGEAMALPDPFVMMATQNPRSHAGTYPLPEAQMDRFMVRLNFHYPDEEAMIRMTGETGREGAVSRVMTPEDLLQIQRTVVDMPIGDDLTRTFVRLVRALWPDAPDAPKYVKDTIEEGPSPRACVAFSRVARALALMDGRGAPDMSDIVSIAGPVLQHRTQMKYSTDPAGAFQETLHKAMQSVGMKIG